MRHCVRLIFHLSFISSIVVLYWSIPGVTSQWEPIYGRENQHLMNERFPRQSFSSGSNEFNTINITTENLLFLENEFGSMSRFDIPPGVDAQWVAYFFEETLATVLKTPSNLMIDCTVIEVRHDEDQKMSKKMIGSFMEIIPIELSDMIYLTRLCGELPKNNLLSSPDLSSRTGGVESRGSASQASLIILPGTLWCGIRDSAERYENIGQKQQLDKCCRVHDHCPMKVGAFQTRYGVTNVGFSTRSHCLCEDEFYQCLKNVSNKIADGIGNFYFNVLKSKCLDGSIVAGTPSMIRGRANGGFQRTTNHLYTCMVKDDQGRCRYWGRRNQKISLNLRPYNTFY